MLSNLKKHWYIERHLKFTFHFIHQRYQKRISYKMKYLALLHTSLVVLIVIIKQILAHEDDICQANDQKIDYAIQNYIDNPCLRMDVKQYLLTINFVMDNAVQPIHL